MAGFLAKEVHHLKESAESLLHGRHEGSGGSKPGAAMAGAPPGPAEEGTLAGADAAAVAEVVHAHNTLQAETIPTYTPEMADPDMSVDGSLATGQGTVVQG
ncbi:hypothetical protein ABPG75_007414 [Micractinium tetrahymenae]